ncbi:MAG TPA: peptidylprolyl isomerase [Acetobacteraceae bacterium]|nr:peptidylprolyl isomerase [Acetobacteraceae bacterium]
MTDCVLSGRRRLPVILAVISVVVCASADCYAQAPRHEALPAPGYQPGQDLKSPTDPVVAIVDGRSLYLSELGDLARELGAGDRQASFASIYSALLDGLVDHTALELKARRLHLDEKPDVKRRMAEAAGRALEQALLGEIVDEQVTEAAIRAAYAADFAGRPVIEAAHLWIILAPTQDAARQAVARLRAGADFPTVARAISKDPSAAAGGDIGFMRRDQLLPDIARTAFDLPPDQVAPDPVRGGWGWYVIRVQQRGTVPTPSYEAVHDELRQKLKERAIVEAVKQARSEASVQEFNMDGSSITDNGGPLLPYLPFVPDNQ